MDNNYTFRMKQLSKMEELIMKERIAVQYATTGTKRREIEKYISDEIKLCVEYGIKAIKYYTITEKGSPRHRHYEDFTSDFERVLKAKKLNYTLGNDAPRGGQLGNYLLIKIDKRNAFIKSLKN